MFNAVIPAIILTFLTVTSALAEAGECSTLFRGAIVDAKVVNGMVQVTYSSGEVATFYRTDRSKSKSSEGVSLQGIYPDRMLDFSALVGKRVLDAGTGDGAFVYELIKHGADAVGVDPVLNDLQKANPDLFIESGMGATGLPTASVDVIYSSYSMITYSFQWGGSHKNPQAVKEALLEFRRILKLGGVVRIAPLAAKDIMPLLKEVGGFKLVEPQKDRDGYVERRERETVELMRVQE